MFLDKSLYAKKKNAHYEAFILKKGTTKRPGIEKVTKPVCFVMPNLWCNNQFFEKTLYAIDKRLLKVLYLIMLLVCIRDVFVHIISIMWFFILQP